MPGGAVIIAVDAPSVLKSRVGAAFDPTGWQGLANIEPTGAGRGAAWFIETPQFSCVLKHYRRGGWASRVFVDQYLWIGERRVRSLAEWRLLRELYLQGLPVPRPLAAHYARSGWLYRCDLMTERIEARTLSTHFTQRAFAEPVWRSAGQAVAALHRAGVRHADLNAHNILIEPDGKAHIIDFDSAQICAPGAWRRRNLDRLLRSLEKLAQGSGMPLSRSLWQALLEGYRSVLRD